MEQGKSRCNSLLAFAVFVNIILTLSSVGFMIYKVRVLEERVFELQFKSTQTLHDETGENEKDVDIISNRQKRSSESFGSKHCISCHNACVKLFGLGTKAKVRIT